MVEGPEHNRIFISAKLTDNDYIDQTSYIRSLDNLDPITRRQYLDGDWTARHGGNIFNREWLQIVGEAPANAKRVRYWDLAATKPAPNKEPDYTVGLKLAEYGGVFYVEDIRRTRDTPKQVSNLIRQTAELDGVHVRICMEQEPGSSGIAVTDSYAREVLMGFTYHAIRSTGPKEERAAPVSSACEAGNVKICRGTWNSAFLDEVEAFPLGSHDDQVDCLSGAYTQLAKPTGRVSFV
jgi:predicted phage terminase large subunit-like protein